MTREQTVDCFLGLKGSVTSDRLCPKVNLTGCERCITGHLPALTTSTDCPMTEPDLGESWAAERPRPLTLLPFVSS